LEEPNELTDEYDLDKARAETGRQAVLTTGSVIKSKDGGNQYKRQTIVMVIADVVYAGVYYLDSRNVYIPIDKLQEAVYPDSDKPLADQINIKLKTGEDPAAALAQIRGVWKTFAERKLGWSENQADAATIETAAQMQARFVGEVRKQMGVLLLIFGVVSLSAVLLIFCIFYMIVETRRKDIAILKSCGATSGTVAVVFTGFGGVIGIIGAAGGTLLGYIVTRNINTIEGWIRAAFGLKLWKSSVYMFSRIPNEMDWSAVEKIVIASIIAACIGALLPAITAAMVRPVSVLRYE
jgi:ABC-type lipoprotein release transport system permease subunit